MWSIFHHHCLAQLSQQIFLLLAELGRCLHPNLHDEITLAVLIQVRNTLAAQLKRLATLSPLGNLDRGWAFQRLEF